MTDNEIIKALECCLLSNEQQEERCAECPLYETYEMICQNLLAYYSLDLINRQKAKIEALQMDNAQLQSDVVNANMNLHHAQAELDRFTAMVDAAEDCLLPLPFKNAFDEEIAKAKSEAIKEFAERLKEILDSAFGYEDIYRKPKEETYRIIDMVIKEMAE